jgi:MoxR-like ATPase
VLLADEINRTPPKTQAALLEAMQEKTVTVAGKVHALEEPFIVLATQNPIEQEGTYPLPEAQLDRFLFELQMVYPSAADEHRVVAQHSFAPTEHLAPLVSARAHPGAARGDRPRACRAERRRLRGAPRPATRPGDDSASAEVKRWVRWGASPRATQNLVVAGARAPPARAASTSRART